MIKGYSEWLIVREESMIMAMRKATMIATRRPKIVSRVVVHTAGQRLTRSSHVEETIKLGDGRTEGFTLKTLTASCQMPSTTARKSAGGTILDAHAATDLPLGVRRRCSGIPVGSGPDRRPRGREERAIHRKSSFPTREPGGCGAVWFLHPGLAGQMLPEASCAAAQTSEADR